MGATINIESLNNDQQKALDFMKIMLENNAWMMNSPWQTVWSELVSTALLKIFKGTLRVLPLMDS